MIDRICLLLEAMSVVVCLHHLYGEKFRLDIKTVGFLAVDMIIMEFINHYDLPKSYTLVIYPVIAGYCCLRFGYKIKKLFINNLLCIALIGVTQLSAAFLSYYLFNVSFFKELQLMMINLCAFLFMILIIKGINFCRISEGLQNREKIVVVTIGIGVTVLLFCVVAYKSLNGLLAYEYFFLMVLIIFTCMLCALLEKYRIESKKAMIELKMHELYADSYKTLIENVRMRQHEFDNHISTIYSQHLLCDTYESLVKVQKDYCKELEKENRYNKLLKYDNSVIRGFLYVKFLEAEKLGIEVSYKVVIDNLAIQMPVYKLVEILGDLINNAVEAMMETENEKKLHVSIIEVEDKVEIEVRNTSRYISNKERARFFEKGYSRKGENRGLGLYNVKKICEEYGFEIICDNKIIEDSNWLAFFVLN